MKKQNIKYILGFLFTIYVCVMIYLFALNGRYERVANGIVLDKWKKELLKGGSEHLPLKE